MEQDEQPVRQPRLDHRRRDADRQQLLPADHSVLALGKRRNSNSGV
jgi:hypothetical protein